MSGLEIIFITSVLALLIIWTWFIIQGFKTSRLWGAGLIFLFPISPFMFAYRFERKTRQVIYYFIGCLVFFVGLQFYIHFATIDFFTNFSHKISKALPKIESSSKPEVKTLNLPKPTPIPEPLTVTPEQTKEPVEKAPELPPQIRKYKAVDIGSAGNYVGKSVLVTTASGAKQQGKLLSANNSEIEIKMRMGGGVATITIRKSKVVKFEVYL